MSDSEWLAKRGIMMTDERISAYGGFSVPVEFLEEAAAQINRQGLPMHLGHDLARPLRVRNVRAYVHADEGVNQLWCNLEVHQDDVRWFETLPGMSVTMTLPIERDSRVGRGTRGGVTISADHAWFDDDSLVAAESALTVDERCDETISINRAYQFGLVPDPQIYVDVAYAVLLSIGANVIWDGVKVLWRRRRTPEGSSAEVPTTVNWTISTREHSVTAVIKTSDEATASKAIESLEHATAAVFGADERQAEGVHEGSSKTVIAWDADSSTWTPPH
ncbi:hypothetical protein [Microbacterium sp. NPDC087591]|uniref:hypothetical protein n=1 Tax=Microbacterium sp. NPDC087591 TaxID=3364192 RepID=UPI00381BEE95